MLQESGDPTIELAAGFIFLDVTSLGQGVEYFRKVHLIVWETVELQHSGPPPESALPIGYRPETFKSEPQGQAGFHLRQI